MYSLLLQGLPAQSSFLALFSPPWDHPASCLPSFFQAPFPDCDSSISATSWSPRNPSGSGAGTSSGPAHGRSLRCGHRSSALKWTLKVHPTILSKAQNVLASIPQSLPLPLPGVSQEAPPRSGPCFRLEPPTDTQQVIHSRLVKEWLFWAHIFVNFPQGPKEGETQSPCRTTSQNVSSPKCDFTLRYSHS